MREKETRQNNYALKNGRKNLMKSVKNEKKKSL